MPPPGAGREPAAEPRRHRNHLIWLGPLVALAGVLSYFMFFVRFAALRDFPWVNLPLVALGVTLSLLGLWRALARPAVYRGKILGSVGALLSLSLAGLFGLYVFSWSYGVPAPSERALAIEQAPDFSLLDQDGRTVGLSDLRGTKVVLVFYRGYW